MGKGRTLAKLALLSGLALAGCKNEKYEGFVDMKNNKINFISSDSTEYLELFDKTSKVTLKLFYNKDKKQMDSIILSQGKYRTKFDENSAPENLDNFDVTFRESQLKYQINHDLDSIFKERGE